MGAFLDKPKTDKHNECGEGNGLRFGLSSMQGWRVEMEDAHCANIGLPGLPNWNFFAIFDGHAGTKVSSYCAGELLRSIVGNQHFKGNEAEPKEIECEEPSTEQVLSGIKTGFLELDSSIRDLPETLSGEDKSGSTAVCALISPNKIFFANCGDSRAVLSRDGEAVFGTYDHKPVNPVERERIQNAGGSVMIQRVNGSLAVSRALGDFEYKNVAGMGPCDQLVSPEPEITVEERKNQDEFIALACDGIWDVMTNDELCDFVRHRMFITNDLNDICNQVIDTCLNKGSRDNMSIVLVAFEGAPKVSAEARRKEAELDALLETKVLEIIKSSPADATVLQYVMHLLAIDDDIQGLPPGGGIQAKRSTVEAILNRHMTSSQMTSSQPNGSSSIATITTDSVESK